LALNWLPATSIQKRLKDATAPKEEKAEADEAEQVKATTAVSADSGDSDP